MLTTTSYKQRPLLRRSGNAFEPESRCGFLLLSNVNRNTWIPDNSSQGWRAGGAYSYMPNTTLVGNAYHYFIQITPTIPSFRQCFLVGI